MKPLTAQPDAALRQRVVDGIGVLLPQVLKRDVPTMPESARLFDELGLSSVTTLELLLELEENLEIQINVEDIDQDDLRSIGTLADFVTEHALTDE
jgi:acyl carrier protein